MVTSLAQQKVFSTEEDSVPVPGDDLANGAADAAGLAIGGVADTVLTQSHQLAESAKSLLNSAQNGGFGFKPAAADTMIKALNQSLHTINGMHDGVMAISQAPKLGLTPGAQRVAPFTQSVAIDPELGFHQAVQNLRQTLTDMITAYDAAKKSYNESDTIAAQRMRGLHHE